MMIEAAASEPGKTTISFEEFKDILFWAVSVALCVSFFGRVCMRQAHKPKNKAGYVCVLFERVCMRQAHRKYSKLPRNAK